MISIKTEKEHQSNPHYQEFITSTTKLPETKKYELKVSISNIRTCWLYQFSE
jgi:hypothetical protein